MESRDLAAKGLSISEIARQVGCDPGNAMSMSAELIRVEGILTQLGLDKAASIVGSTA